MKSKLLLLLVLPLIFHALESQAQIPIPKRLAVYYAYPSLVNNAGGGIQAAVNTFSQYDIILFGDGLQFPQSTGNPGENTEWGCNQTHHNDHDTTAGIISALVSSGKQVFGYTTAGGNKTAYKNTTSPCAPTVDEIKKRIDMWKAMGVTGIFLDEAEWEFGSSRVRQNTLINYVHSKGLTVMINGFSPDDIFSPAPVYEIYEELVSGGSLSLKPGTSNQYSVYHPRHGFTVNDRLFVKHLSTAPYYGVHNVTKVIDQDHYETVNSWSPPPGERKNSAELRVLLQMNPDGLPTAIQSGDIYMLESYVIANGYYSEWLKRTIETKAYKTQIGFKVAALTTNFCPSDCTATEWDCLSGMSAFLAQKFNFAWQSAFLFGFEYVGWGEANDFSAGGPCKQKFPMRYSSAPKTYKASTSAGIIDEFNMPHPGKPNVVQLSPTQTSEFHSDTFLLPGSAISVYGTMFKTQQYGNPASAPSKCIYAFLNANNGSSFNGLFASSDAGLYTQEFSRTYGFEPGLLKHKQGINVTFLRHNWILKVTIRLIKTGGGISSALSN